MTLRVRIGLAILASLVGWSYAAEQPPAAMTHNQAHVVVMSHAKENSR